MRRGITTAVLAAAVCAPAASATPEPSPPASVWMAQRVSPHAKAVTVNAYYGWDRRGARVTFVVAKVANGRPRPYDALTMESPLTDGPGVYHGGTSYGCYAGSGCDVLSGPGRTDFTVAATDASHPPDRIYVAVAGLTPEVRLIDSPGWRLSKTSLRVRYATSDTGGGATGAQFFGEHVERFEHASLAGGRRGSLVVATLPCRPLHRFGVFREGFGTATLSGGPKPVTFDCQKDLHDATAAADHATTWKLDGLVVGTAAGTTRLAVIDL